MCQLRERVLQLLQPHRFFFQAEDGIRDLYVTGVQTCALPISFACSDGMRNAGPWIITAAAAWARVLAASIAQRRAAPTSYAEIGRASCRERVEISVVAGAVKRKVTHSGN